MCSDLIFYQMSLLRAYNTILDFQNSENLGIVNKTVDRKKRPQTNLTSSGQASMGALKTQRLKVATQDGLNIKISTRKQVTVDSHILGL